VDNYTIIGTSFVTTTSQVNETTVTLPYSVSQNIGVTATNCNGTSETATFAYFEGETNSFSCSYTHSLTPHVAALARQALCVHTYLSLILRPTQLFVTCNEWNCDIDCAHCLTFVAALALHT